jgi:hypothetical protein
VIPSLLISPIPFTTIPPPSITLPNPAVKLESRSNLEKQKKREKEKNRTHKPGNQLENKTTYDGGSI